jgi:hypothetical protein
MRVSDLSDKTRCSHSITDTHQITNHNSNGKNDNETEEGEIDDLEEGELKSDGDEEEEEEGEEGDEDNDDSRKSPPPRVSECFHVITAPRDDPN